MRSAIFGLSLIAFASPAAAQSFSLSDSAPTQTHRPHAGAPRLSFRLAEPPARLSFSFIPPARKMFLDQTGSIILYPALFADGVSFHRLAGPSPAYFAQRFQGAFTAYRIGDFYVALQAGYEVHSATIRDGELFVLAKDREGNFVALSPGHIAVAQADGTPTELREAPPKPSVVSLLIDRSGSISGFDADINAALSVVSETLASSDRCALYEFGQSVRAIQKPAETTCGKVISGYQMSEAGGGTPLYETMAHAYADLASENGISALVIVSDGSPTDEPSEGLAAAAARTPTFVLWVGNHQADYLAPYSTSHAIASSGAREEVEDFLRAISVSVRGHQRFTISETKKP